MFAIRKNTLISCNVLKITSANPTSFAESCDGTSFVCRSGVGCVDDTLRCNGVRNCLDGSDEFGCCKLTLIKVSLIVFTINNVSNTIRLTAFMVILQRL